LKRNKSGIIGEVGSSHEELDVSLAPMGKEHREDYANIVHCVKLSVAIILM
jgi:hypothetical protein